MASNVLETIKRIAKENNINIPENKYETNLKELGIDSLKLMNLVFKIEDALKVRIPDQELINIKTINDLVKILETL